MAVEVSTVSNYVYCLSYDGLWRLKIPRCDESDKHDESELKMECVFTCDPDLLPFDMRICSGPGHNVYMVGGKDDHPILHVFDPTSFKQIPVEGPQVLYKQMKMPDGKFETLEYPMVIRAKDQIYFLTQYVNPWFFQSIERICFQSFDPNEYHVRNLPSPFYKPSPSYEGTTSERLEIPPDHAPWTVASCFAAFDYIYLFIQDTIDRKEMFKFTSAFSFDTRSLEWEEAKLTGEEFTKKRIPIPLLHRGDIGFSKEFPGRTWFLVALCDMKPTAYLVTLDQHGHLNPISFRFLEEIKFKDNAGIVQLHDIGSGRFCAIYENSYFIPLKFYVFKIDFQVEYTIQCSHRVSPPLARTSSELLCSMTYVNIKPSIAVPSFYAYCLASAPASQSFGNQIAAAEEQDRGGKMNKGTLERVEGNAQAKGKINSQEELPTFLVSFP